MKAERHLVIFAKAPRLGAVKSRLARDIGPVAAWAFYRRTLYAVLKRLGHRAVWRCWLAVTPDWAAGKTALWPAGWSIIPQGRGDLGHRMARVMRDLPPGPTVIIGTDIPAVRRDHVWRAFAALGRHQAVFGPAADGGYWLVGLRRHPRVPAIFGGVRWSSAYALSDTVGNLGKRSTVAYMETLDDVDDGAALARWRESARRKL